MTTTPSTKPLTDIVSDTFVHNLGSSKLSQIGSKQTRVYDVHRMPSLWKPSKHKGKKVKA